MSKTITNARIKHRVDSTANWNTKNPILYKGEIGLEILTATTFRVKFGNGLQAWKDLPYLADTEILAKIQALADAAKSSADAAATSEANAKSSADSAASINKQIIDDAYGFSVVDGGLNATYDE